MSWQLSLFNAASRNVVKPVLRRQSNVDHARRSFRRMTQALCRPPPFTVALADRDLDADWIWSGQVSSRGILLYLHGGGYILGSPTTHRALIARLARLTGLRAIAPDYRLAPENPLPAALRDVRAVWDALCRRGYRPEDIVIGGDSAGGGLALALLAQLCNEGQAPRAVFAFSPWTDLMLRGASLADNAQSDAFFPADRVGELRDMVVGVQDPAGADVSPLYGEFPGCPPVFLQCSGAEILRDDSVRMAARLRGFGADVTLDVVPDMPHVWHLFDRVLPEAKAALRQTAEFVTAQFPPSR